MIEKEQLFKENHFLEQFRKLYEPIQKLNFVKTESPDFVTEANNDVSIGIEITELVNQKEPSAKYSPAQRNSLEKKIVEIAKQEFLNTYNIPLHVSFWFRDDFNCRKGEEDKIAFLLKNLIRDLIKDEDLTKAFHLSNDRPNEDFLVTYDVSYFPKVSESIWYNTKAKIVPNPEPEEIISLIRNKEKKMKMYRQKASRIYLLIVEGLIPISWYDSFKEIENYYYETSFDKLFILRNLTNTLIELRKNPHNNAALP